MIVRELAQKFMTTDPKQRCIVCCEGELIYDGRIEFLYNCGNPIEDMDIVALQTGFLDSSCEWVPEVLSIGVAKSRG